MEKEKIIKLAKKLYALKMQGVGGEAENAGRQLEAIMKKHDLSMSDVDDTERKTKRIIVVPKRGPMRVLCGQLIYKICGHVDIFTSRDKSRYFVDMTDREFAELEYMRPIHEKAMKKHMEKQRKIAMHAYIQTQNLFAEGPDPNPSDRKLTQEEIDIIREAMKQQVDHVGVYIPLK